MAGRLSGYLAKWREITSDPVILQAIKGYKLPFKYHPPRQEFEPSIQLSDKEMKICRQEIENLYAKGAIEPVSDCEGQFLSPYFVIKKHSGGWRFILNLKRLNEYIIAPHFKLENWKTVVQLLSPGDFLASIDIQDAYLHIPIYPEDRRYLRFRFQGQLYQFRALPFGLASAPFIFTKCLKPALSYLRERGFLLVAFLDDFLIIAPSYEVCVHSVSETSNLLNSLGFLINKRKSVFSPSTSCLYLGFIFDSIYFSISIPREKRERLLKLTRSFLDKRACTIREFASFIGSLISICPAVQYRILHTKTQVARCRHYNVDLRSFLVI